ncbi:acyltransferase [Ekhidna sp.]|uniref:acyltransferase n=1 Tax=Ekhidna sp. TaxID=2608089 RepID=UPI003B59D7B4
MKAFLKKIVVHFYRKADSWNRELKVEELRRNFLIHKSIRFWNLSLEGNIEIGEGTYLNDSCRIDSGKNSKVNIGKYCAIGRWVHITSKTHDLKQPTPNGKIKTIPHIESDTLIGNYVWIGDHCVISHGVKIGDHAVIGANSFVNKDVKPFEIVGGVPAKHIRYNDKNILFKG